MATTIVPAAATLVRNPAPDQLPVENLMEDRLLLRAPRGFHSGMRVPVLGEFPVLRLLSTGGFGNVYLGWNPRLGVHVAIKVLRPEVLRKSGDVYKRFEREAHVTARVRSPHVVTVYDMNADAASSLHYLVMEYFGISAQAYLDEVKQAGRPGLAEEEALATCIAAAQGLADLHAAGAIHRDVKPGNILLSVEGMRRPPRFERAKLTDLGLVRLEESREVLAGSRLICGSPEFMAPEQTISAHSAGKAADIYGLGATLHALLCGAPPFTGKMGEVIRAVQHDQPVPIYRLRSDVSGETSVVVERCLAKKPEDRFPDARELVDALVLCQQAAREKLAGGAGAPLWNRKAPRATFRLKLLDRWRYGMFVRPAIETALQEEFAWADKPFALGVFAIDELVGNAFEHGCQGAGDREITVTLSVLAALGVLEVTVSDQGSGFDLQRELANATRRQASPGRGLGLTVVKHIAADLVAADGGRTVRAVLNRAQLEACQPIPSARWPATTRAPRPAASGAARGRAADPSKVETVSADTRGSTARLEPPRLAEIRKNGLQLELFNFTESFGTVRLGTVTRHLVTFPAQPGLAAAEELEHAVKVTLDELFGKVPTLAEQEDKRGHGKLKAPVMQIAGFPDLRFVLVRLSGLLGGEIVPLFRERLGALVKAGHTHYVLYMANVCSVRTEWLGAALHVLETVDEAGGALIVVNPSAHAWQQAEFAGFHQLVRKEDRLLNCVDGMRA